MVFNIAAGWGFRPLQVTYRNCPSLDIDAAIMISITPSDV
jgi:hypothetical protein